MNDRKEPSQLKKNRTAEQSVENEILEALTDFTDALEKGEVTQRFNSRQIKLNLVPTPYSPELVKETRKVLGVSQSLFARFLGVSPKTVRAWEQGVNAPHKMACRFMDEIRQNPQFWTQRLREVAVERHHDEGCPF
jgi:putative transcriptional regulator